jgi:hypothetical protein
LAFEFPSKTPISLWTLTLALSDGPAGLLCNPGIAYGAGTLARLHAFAVQALQMLSQQQDARAAEYGANNNLCGAKDGPHRILMPPERSTTQGGDGHDGRCFVPHPEFRATQT